MTSYDLTNDFEFILEDRLSVIRQTDKEYDLENNAYISFSGGKDSTLVHYLIDMALPNNKIPRVFIDTGIEYNDIREFVYDLAAKDNRFVIIKPQKPIIKVLQEYGYPFKSKQHSHNVYIFQNNKEKTINFINQCESNPKLLNDYDFIHNLPNGVKRI